MSFSGEVKQELTKQFSKARHCELAELQALVDFSGSYRQTGSLGVRILFKSENLFAATKCFTLLRKTFNIKTDVMVRQKEGNECLTYYLTAGGLELAAIPNASLSGICCKRAYIRGAFLSSGSVSDPRKSYHFEIVCSTIHHANKLQEVMKSFALDAKVVKRKHAYIVYLKDGSQIVDILNIMGAHIALMELENIRILKDMRNNVNRKVNCETANINKTVSASVKQLLDIKLIRDSIGLNNLPGGLTQISMARLENPDVSLKELGALLDPPIGKSGVNHRLRKLSEIAEDLRDKQGG